MSANRVLSVVLMVFGAGMVLCAANPGPPSSCTVPVAEASSIYGGNSCSAWILVLKCDSMECGQQYGFNCAIDGNIGMVDSYSWCCSTSNSFPAHLNPDRCFPE